VTRVEVMNEVVTLSTILGLVNISWQLLPLDRKFVGFLCHELDYFPDLDFGRH